MAKIVKKKKKGYSAKYFTRTQALRRMQLKLKDFRKLWILKGIYPRDPKVKFRGHDKTYYHRKDITYLEADPILNKFR